MIVSLKAHNFLLNEFHIFIINLAVCGCIAKVLYSVSVCVCVCVFTACYQALFLNCYNLAIEALAATNTEQRIEKRVDFTTVVSKTLSRETKA